MCVLSVSTKESTSSSSINSMLVGVAVDGVEACAVRMCSLYAHNDICMIAFLHW